MRILWLSHGWFPDAVGGVERVARDAAAALADRGHAVTAVVPVTPGKPVREANGGLEVRRLVRRTAGIPQTYSDPVRFRQIVRHVDPGDFDVVVAHNVSTAFGAEALDLPVSYVFHGSEMRELNQRRAHGISRVAHLRTHAVAPVLRALERRAPRRSTSTLVLSEFSRRILVADAPVVADKVLRVSGGVDLGKWVPAPDRDELRARLGFSDGDKIVFTARRLVARTGVDLLLESFALVAHQDPVVRLVIAGDGELRGALLQRSEAIGLSDRIRFLGRISDTELLHWYQAADIFALPTIAYEGFGMATVEALATGAPVAATSIGATPEIISDLEPAWLAPTPTPPALAGAISRALADAGRGRREGCREYAARRFSWDRVGAQWEAALDETIARYRR